MHRIGAFMVLVIFGCCVTARWAAADRLIRIPEGITLGAREVKGEIAVNGGAKAYWANIGSPNVEIEGAWFGGFEGGNSMAVSAQVGILPDTSFTPAVALGIRDIGNTTRGSEGFYDGRAVYLAASKSLDVSEKTPFLKEVKIHGGLGTGSLGPVFLGAEAGIPGGFHLAAEYDAHDVNFSVAFDVQRTVRVRLSTMDGAAYYGLRVSASL